MMKSMTKSLLAASLLSASVMAEAGLTANVGATSDYLFRGVNLSDGAGISAGIDYEAENGIYLGAWAIGFDDSVNLAADGSQPDEVEVDLYGGYAGTIGDFSYSVGYTGFFYDELDVDIHELNFNFGYSFLNLEVTFGTEDDDTGDGDDDYTFVALTGEYEGGYLTYGSFGDDFDGDYVELGYGFNVEGLDIGIAYVNAESELSSPDDTVYVTLNKTFEIF